MDQSMTKPKTFDALVRAGGPERFVREATEQAAQNEREYWLKALEREPLPRDKKKAALYAAYIGDLRRKLSVGRLDVIAREDMRGRVQRLRALGTWGEHKAVALLKRAGFTDVRELNSNHPFADIQATRVGKKYLIGVKTRNKYQVSGLLNPTYNIRKRGADVEAIARQHGAILAWVAISVIPEERKFSAYFGTIDEIQVGGERFSIPMMPKQTARYVCLSRPVEEADPSIQTEWSNGGYPNRRK
jgi:hypothetical protein